MGVAVSQTHGFLRHRLDGCYSLLLNELQVLLTAEYTNSGKRDPPRSVRALIGLWGMGLSDRSGGGRTRRGGGDGELVSLGIPCLVEGHLPRVCPTADCISKSLHDSVEATNSRAFRIDFNADK